MNAARPSANWERIALYVFGTVACAALIVIALFDKHPSAGPWFIYNTVLALAAGGVGALLPGLMKLSVHPGIRATGAIAIFFAVFFYGKDRKMDDTMEQPMRSELGLRSRLVAPNGGGLEPWSDIYVVINSKLAAYVPGGIGPKDLDFGKNVWNDGTKSASVERGNGGVVVDYGPLTQGDRITIIAKNQSGVWWISNDIKVPEGDLGMQQATFSLVKTRFANGQ